ncbi:hypothetical protein LMORI2_19720 [Limnohabitans sp. MORI2]|uniref:hypothetical protein n=1 Tax=Limnohabitans sp. MORI2 TaxID=1751150 RepID=UPI002376F741|nr:hypothetical protein [Limnohabitans sp. MORI2]BDU58990.1 hypothetical protein LMORI2_19720 [Limnohabitans sp. MORI2]
MTQSYKQLLAQLAPTSADAQLDQPTENKNRFEKLLVWIDQNIDSPISLNDLLAQSGLSLLELNRQFKLHTKQSPLQFIKEFRKFKQEAALANQPIIDQTYALFDPFKK